jgi:hypothetical protein
LGNSPNLTTTCWGDKIILKKSYTNDIPLEKPLNSILQRAF